MNEIFKALANPHRFAIVNLLADNCDNSFSVLELADAVQLSQSQTSQHIAKLRKVGLIVSKQDGTTVWNRIAPNVNWPVKVFK